MGSMVVISATNSSWVSQLGNKELAVGTLWIIHWRQLRVICRKLYREREDCWGRCFFDKTCYFFFLKKGYQGTFFLLKSAVTRVWTYYIFCFFLNHFQHCVCVCMFCVCVCMCVLAHLSWHGFWDESTTYGSLFSPSYVCSRGWTRVIGLGSKCLYPVSLNAGPLAKLPNSCVFSLVYRLSFLGLCLITLLLLWRNTMTKVIYKVSI